MGGCRCSYKNCQNTTKTRENLHFFHYPVKYKERCQQWIENAHKPQFYDLEEEQLRNKVICETHFEDCVFLNHQKKRLVQSAVPTLDGDSVMGVVAMDLQNTIKLQDVKVLPANDDGTIFVLDSDNLQPSFKSHQVQSYIYTNNGLVLPIEKCEEFVGNYGGKEPVNYKEQVDVSSSNTSSTDLIIDKKPFSEPTSPNIDSIMRTPPPLVRAPQMSHSEDIFKNTVDNKYVRKIRQHSKDIAILKRMLKTKTVPRKPSNATILQQLKKQIPASLYGLVKLNLVGNFNIPSEDVDFYTNICSTSPKLYQLLMTKYNWKMPHPSRLVDFTDNGHMESD